jgi:hypothetical protein
MTMLSRFCRAIAITGAAEAGEGAGFEALRFDGFAAVLACMLIPGRWRVRPLGSLTLTLSPAEVFPPICPHHVTGIAVKA